MLRIVISFMLIAASLRPVTTNDGSVPVPYNTGSPVQQLPFGVSVKELVARLLKRPTDPASSRSVDNSDSSNWANSKMFNSGDISKSSLDALLKDIFKDLPKAADALRSGPSDSYEGKSNGYYQPIKNNYYPSYEKPSYPLQPPSQGYNTIKKPIVPYSENLGVPLLDLLDKKVILKIVVSFVLLFKKIIPLLLPSFGEFLEKPKPEYPQQPVYPEYPVDNYKPPSYLQSNYNYKPPTRPYKPLGLQYRPPMPYDRSSSSNQKL